MDETADDTSALRRIACLLAGAALLAACGSTPQIEYLVRVPWARAGLTLVLDTHTHTHFSDGALSVRALVDLARAGGCDVLAVTDHGDLGLRAATPAYFDAVDAERARVPGMLLFAGMEWNIPPYAGREHVTVLLEPRHERGVLPEFKARYEPPDASAEAALRWLAQQAPSATLVYNHPSRRDASVEENRHDLTRWRSVNRLFLGFEGGPGHQRAVNPGAYDGVLKTINRWDPVVAETGGVWDRMLDEGHDVWGALAVSDYHDDRQDYGPCTFARTHVRVAGRDHASVLRALQAGSFWADHGRILDDLSFAVVDAASGTAALPGETISAGRAARLEVRIGISRGPGSAGQPLVVDIIGNSGDGGPQRLAGTILQPGETAYHWRPQALRAGADGRSVYFRIRVTAPHAAGGPLSAYANPVRVVIR